VTYHSTPAEIAGLMHGTLSRVARQRLVTHLLRGCPSCSRLLAPGLASQQAPQVLHVLHGQDVLDNAEARTRMAVPGGDPIAALDPIDPIDPTDPYELPVARACAAAVRRMRAPLRAIRGRRADVVPVAGGEARRGPLRVEMLLAASWELRHSDAHEMVRLAELALSAAERLAPARYGQDATADLRARVWAELANAHRVAAELPEADRAMARAVAWQHRGSGDPWLLVRIADLMASLLADQRRLAEAGELLGMVHSFYRRNGERHLAGRALVSSGIFAGYDNDPRAALLLLTEGMESIDPREDEQLAAQAVQAIVWNLVDCGRFRQARIHLWRSRPLLVRHGGTLHLLRLRWLEGRIHAGLRDFGRAEGELAAARLGFEAAGSPYNAALTSLDLAAVWLQQGKTKQVRQLVEEMIAIFRALRIAREAVAALLILREACDRDAASLEQLRSVALLLAELERRPRRRHSQNNENSETSDAEGVAD
jgi:hypothetical protein